MIVFIIEYSSSAGPDEYTAIPRENFKTFTVPKMGEFGQIVFPTEPATQQRPVIRFGATGGTAELISNENIFDRRFKIDVSEFAQKSIGKSDTRLDMIIKAEYTPHYENDYAAASYESHAAFVKAADSFRTDYNDRFTYGYISTCW